MNIVVNNALTPDPATIRFAQIKAVLQAKTGLVAGIPTATLNDCLFCHTTTSLAHPAPSLANIAQTPVTYDNVDRNGDGGVPDATDDEWLYAEVRGRINFNDVADSPLLLKPSGKHHGGLLQKGFDSTLVPGVTTGGLLNPQGRTNYDLFLNWILNGAPY
jgi:hypothetical protein